MKIPNPKTLISVPVKFISFSFSFFLTISTPPFPTNTISEFPLIISDKCHISVKHSKSIIEEITGIR